MIDIKLTNDHDIDTSSLDFNLISGAESVKQQLLIKLRLWRGEWFLDTDFGTPYLQNVLGKQLTLSGAVTSIRKSIMEVEGVLKISKFVYTFNRFERNLRVSFTADTTEGIIEVTA